MRKKEAPQTNRQLIPVAKFFPSLPTFYAHN